MSATERSIAAGFAIPEPGDLRRRAVHRLEDPGAVVSEGGGSGEPEPAGHGRGDIGEDVAEGVLGDDGVDALRRLHDRHRERVDERVVEGDLRVVARAHLGHDVPPEPRGVHDVDLVDRGQPPAPLGGDLESPACDALDLGPRVLARVVPRAVLADALLAEVEAADELPHDHDVDSGAASRAEVRVDAELLAQRRGAPAPDAPACPRARAGRRPRAAPHRPRGRRRASRRAAGCPAQEWRCRRTRARECPIPSASSTRTASAATSGPIPSPGRTATWVIAPLSL